MKQLHVGDDGDGVQVHGFVPPKLDKVCSN